MIVFWFLRSYGSIFPIVVIYRENQLELYQLPTSLLMKVFKNILLKARFPLIFYHWILIFLSLTKFIHGLPHILLKASLAL